MNGNNEPTLVTEPAKKMLNSREQTLYKDHRRDMAEWLDARGKRPADYEGYSSRTVKQTLARLDMFYRWVWNEITGIFTTDITHAHADAFVDWLRRDDDRSNADKKKHVMCLKRLFKWRHHEHDVDLWDTDASFPTRQSNPRDYLDEDERRKIRSAALDYAGVPDFESIETEELDHWKAVLAQRLGKPKHEISPDDWGRANSWKIPSLVWVSLDAGLRPAEVEKASVKWFRPKKAVLNIPAKDSVKNRDNWEVTLRRDTADILQKWIDERDQTEDYDDTDLIWLTGQGNPYQTSALSHVINNLAESAGIDTEHRSLSWYSIRHSVGTALASKKGLPEAKRQLRHKSRETTLKYVHPDNEDIRDGLDQMG